MNTPTIELTDHEGYDMFRRAIVGRDGQAWAVIYTRYRGLLLAWARRFSVRLSVDERADDVADQAFARAWSALTPERFGQFPTLASLLAYLRSCVSSTVIDIARAQLAHERRIQPAAERSGASAEQLVIGDLERGELWQLVNAVAHSAAERTLLVESFVHDQPPRAIQARHPDLFPSIDAIYRTKRNLLERLQRNPALQGLAVG
jgi:DNA-directed RNA polymerase specialized sigma24 family protein